MDEENILKLEAISAIDEIAFAVNKIELSNVLNSSVEKVYINLETKERQHYSIELTVQGFKIVGNSSDLIDLQATDGVYYETIYSLLDCISPQYRQLFGEALVAKLHQLKEYDG